MSNHPASDCTQLRDAAIAAAKQAHEESEQRMRRAHSLDVERAYAQYKEVFPQLTITEDGQHLELCGDLWVPYVSGIAVGGGPSHYALQLKDGIATIWSLASYGEFLLERERRQQLLASMSWWDRWWWS